MSDKDIVAWMYFGINADGTEHGPHLIWAPEYMDAMSASKGAKAIALCLAPNQPELPGIKVPVSGPEPTSSSIPINSWLDWRLNGVRKEDIN